MFELASFGGAETPAQKQDRALAQGKVPPPGKKTPVDARKSLIADLVATAKACQKSGIDIRNPMIKASLIASGGSALALASRIGPEKTIACIQHFTALSKKHGAYIRHLEKSYREMRIFSRDLRCALGPCPKMAKVAVNKNASVGGWGIVLALGALGAAVFYVVRAFSKSNETVKEKLEATVTSGSPVKLKDAASKKYIDAIQRVRKDEKTGQIISIYTGTRNGADFKVECASGLIPVWSGLEWKCMPRELADKVVIAGLYGFRSGEINAKDIEGVDHCGGSLVELVGHNAFRSDIVGKESAAKRAARIKLMQSLVNWHKAEHMMGYAFVGAGKKGKRKLVRKPVARRKVRAVPAPAPNVTRYAASEFSPLIVRPGPISPLSETLDPALSAVLSQLRHSPPAERANLATVTKRQQPTIWPGARGSYSY